MNNGQKIIERKYKKILRIKNKFYKKIWINKNKNQTNLILTIKVKVFKEIVIKVVILNI